MFFSFTCISDESFFAYVGFVALDHSFVYVCRTAIEDSVNLVRDAIEK